VAAPCGHDEAISGQLLVLAWQFRTARKKFMRLSWAGTRKRRFAPLLIDSRGEVRFRPSAIV
jgi:hypothetical protein